MKTVFKSSYIPHVRGNNVLSRKVTGVCSMSSDNVENTYSVTVHVNSLHQQHLLLVFALISDTGVHTFVCEHARFQFGTVMPCTYIIMTPHSGTINTISHVSIKADRDSQRGRWVERRC